MSLTELERQRDAGEALHAIVGAMRAMAAGRVQGSQRALASAREYERVVIDALRASTPEHSLATPATPTRRSTDLLILTSEHGLCGAFNQDLLGFAEERRQELMREGNASLFVVGNRGRRKLEAAGIALDAAYPAATSVRGLRDVVKQVSVVLSARYATGKVDAMEVVYSRYQSVSQHIPTAELVLPPQLTPNEHAKRYEPAPHRHYLALPALVTGLVREYAFISLYRLVAESYASEQASRLVAMDNALRHTAEFLDDIRQRERRERQNETTRQVLELISARRARSLDD